MSRAEHNEASVRCRVCGAVLTALCGAGLLAAIVGGAVAGDAAGGGPGGQGFVVGDGVWVEGHGDVPHLGGVMFNEPTSQMHLLSVEDSGRASFVPTHRGAIYPRPSQPRTGLNTLRLLGCPYGSLATGRDSAALRLVPRDQPVALVHVRPDDLTPAGLERLRPHLVAMGPAPAPAGPAATASAPAPATGPAPGLAVALHAAPAGQRGSSTLLRQYAHLRGALRAAFPGVLVLTVPPGAKDDLAALHHAAWTLGGKHRLTLLTADADLASAARAAGFSVHSHKTP